MEIEPIEARDYRAFMRDFHTPGTRAYDHALDISVMIWELMQEQGLLPLGESA